MKGDKRKQKIIQLEGLLKDMIEIEEYELCSQIKRMIRGLEEGDTILKLKGMANEYDVKKRIQRLQQKG